MLRVFIIGSGELDSSGSRATQNTPYQYAVIYIYIHIDIWPIEPI